MSMIIIWTAWLLVSFSSLSYEVQAPKQDVDKYNSKPPVPITSIEKGLGNFDHLRAALIESGLRVKESKTYENGSITEYWIYGHEDITVNDPFEGRIVVPIIFFQLSEWHRDDESRFRVVYIRILPEYLPNYAEKFLESIKSFYPLKEVIPVSVTGGDKESTEYILRYSRKESGIYVDFNTNEYNWYEFHFYREIP